MVYSGMQFEVLLLDEARQFITKLPAKLKAKALRTIELLEQFGPELPMPHSRKLAGVDIWELRVRLANDICRLFYFHLQKQIYIVTSGYVKKTDRTSRSEIEKAVRLKREYLAEEGK